MRRLGASVVLLGMLTAACAGSAGRDPQATGPLPPCEPSGLVSVGEALPDCSFEGVSGGTFALASLRGKPSVINFWASWCANCIIEMPHFDELYRQISDDVEFVGMNFLGGINRETRADAERFATKTGVSYPLAYDPDGLFYSHFQRNVERPLMPITVFADAQGVVRGLHFGGPITAEDLRGLITKHLGAA